MPRILPPRPNLNQLKSQARELQRAYNAGEPGALLRVAQQLPAAIRHNPLGEGRQRVILAQALAVLAREHGFASWQRLRQHIAHVRQELQAQAKQARATPSAAQRQQAIARMAERLAEAAERRDLAELFRAIQIGKRDGEAVRERLVAQGQIAAVIDALLVGAENASARVRFLTAQAMDHWADDRCAEPLWALLHDPVPRVRWAAIHSLQCGACKLAPLSPGAHDLVGALCLLALSDPSVQVRRVAAWELGQICPDPRAVAALEQLCAQERDPIALRRARLGLGRRP